MVNSWKNNDVSLIHIELSSFCNAACPFCPRHVNSSLRVRSDLIQTSISLQQFKQWFPPTFFKKIRRVLFCGTHGDPLMAKDAYEIFDYIHQINPGCWQMIHTNGGMRKPEWWKKLGALFRDTNKWVVFSIDGLEDTNHLYRRNVKWENLINNAKAFINAGGVAKWEFLVFKHNEHQIEEARELSKKLGFKEFIIKRPLGFIDHMEDDALTSRGVYDKNGNLEYKLYPATQDLYINKEKVLKLNNTASNKIDLDFISQKRKIDLISKINAWDDSCLKNNKRLQPLNKMCVNCKSHDATYGLEIYVSAQGVVFPCCYVGTRVDSDIDMEEDTQLRKKIKDAGGVDVLRLTNNSVETIINTGVLDKIFTDSWNKPSIEQGKMIYCAQICGEQSEIDRIYDHSKERNI